MKSFFEEYGKIIVTAVVAVSLIAISVALRVPIQNSLTDIVGDWASSTASATLTIEGVNVGDGNSGGDGLTPVEGKYAFAKNGDVNGNGVIDKGDVISLVGVDLGSSTNSNGGSDGVADTFRVLSIEGTKAKVVSMENFEISSYVTDGTSTNFTLADKTTKQGLKYSGSPLDNTMTNYYNSLPSAIQNAIIEQNINQSMYSYSEGINAEADFSAWYKYSFTETTTSNEGTNYYLTRVSEINIGNRKVYALDIDDIIDYFGSSSTPQNINQLFFNTKSSTTNTMQYAFWLRSASSSYNQCAHIIKGCTGYIRYCTYLFECFATYPAFVIDLSLLS